MTIRSIFQQARDETQPQQGREYERPEVTPEMAAALAKAANKINALQDQRVRLVYILAMLHENARLLAECNQHRAALGIDPLPVYDPLKRGEK